MSRFRPFLSLAVGVLSCALLAACGGKTPPNGPSPLNINVTQLVPGAVGDYYQQVIVASGGLTPYTYSITSGSLPKGLTMNTLGVVSGVPAPGTDGSYSFTIKVVDSQTPTAAYNTGTVGLTINPVLAVTGTSLPQATVGVAYTGLVSATGGVTPYSFALSSGTLPAGLTFSTDGTLSGTPTGPVGAYPFTVQATDAAAGTATAALSITVVGKIQGPYAFSFNGYNNGQPFYMTGNLVADGNGNITGGLLDRNGSDSIGTLTDVPITGGTYSVGSNNLGTITIISALGTYNYSVAVSTVSDSRFIQVPDTTNNMWGSGILKKQSIGGLSLSSLAAGYSFGAFGVDSSGKRTAAAGTFTADKSGNFSNAVEDSNDNGMVQSQVPFTGSFNSDLDPTTGRGTATITVGSTTATYAYYVVSIGAGSGGITGANGLSATLLAVQIDPVANGSSLTLATILGQVSAGISGGFNNASLGGGNYKSSIMQLSGVANNAGTLVPDLVLGQITFDGAGNITSFTNDENNGGTLTQNSYTGTYSVATNGRVTVAGIGTDAPVWYLISANRGFVIGTDPSVTYGVFEEQTGSSFSNLSLFSNYYGGSITPLLAGVTNEVDSALATPPPPSATFVSTYDTSGPGGSLMNQTLSATYATPDMTTSRTLIQNSSGQTVEILYIVSGGAAGATNSTTEVVGLEVLNSASQADANPHLSVLVR